MKLLTWFLQFFQPARTPRAGARVKFVEGTEWLCPVCDATIAIARRDIRTSDTMMSSAWEVVDPGFWKAEHCDRHLFDYEPGGRGILICTPTGWVG